MSLHLGNLSSRVRRDELEHVFRRFGRCNVQVRDKFGFVVYDFHANAEKAMRALRGKNICGEPITLSWSNRQPGPVQRFTGGGRSYESQRGRSSVREEYLNRKLGSTGRRDYRVGLKQTGTDSRRSNSAELVDETRSHYIKGVAGEKDHKVREDLPDEGGYVEPNFVDNGRWGEKVGNISNENAVANGLDFDRYEPYHDDGIKDEDEIHRVTHSGGSLALEKSQERKGIEQIGEARLNHLDNAKPQQTCYICGEVDHKMRNCPQKNASKRKKLSRFDFTRENEINFRGKGEPGLKRPRSISRGRLPSGRDAVSMMKHKSDRKSPSSRRYRQLLTSRHSPIAKETHISVRKEHGETKRSRRETGSPERERAMKSRGPLLSPINFDYTASKAGALSKSSTLSSRSSSHSKCRSVTSRSGSPSSSSRPGSISHRSRSGGSKFKSRSRSRENSPSLSLSVGRPLQSSPNKVQIDQKSSLLNAASPESKEVLVEKGQLIEGDAGSDTSKLDIMTVDEGMDNDIYQSDDDNHAISRDTREVKNSCRLENDDLTTGSLSQQSLTEKREDVRVTEHAPTPPKNPESEVSVRSGTAKSMNITSEELYRVLKHYGLEHPKENEKGLPVETYFGCGRLWPWEIIYYRRLKKGLISTENYARRIAQNKEFGIVDKYIRSSSGWGELSHGQS